MKVIRILTLITALFSGGALAADSVQATSAVSLTGEKAVAQLKESGQYDSLAAAYEAARHAVRADEAEPDGVLHAQNPGHGLSASFDRHGLHLSVQRHGSEGDRLTTRWRLDSVGRAGAVEKVPAGDALRRDGQRAEIVRAGLGLTEWFVNRPSGLEHGFTLDRRPAGEGALRLDIAIEGDLSPVPGADGLRIELHDAAGTKVLDYDKLRVWDAAGQELPARMERAAAGGLRFRVEDAGARYPLTVDPTFTQQAYLKASNASAGVIPSLGDGFGFSVAVDGNTVVIGAISEDGNATSSAASPNDNAPDAGAAYVFTRNGTTWTQQAYLKASNAGVGDSFGDSVAVSGDTAVVGASQEKGDAASTAASPNDNASQAGAAYVFTRSGTTWTQQAYLKASNAGVADFFGGSVAVSGDTVVVGAPNEDGNAASTAASPNDNAIDAGAAYVFTRSGTTWTQQAYLKAANAENEDQFGRSVAISGNTVVVGSEGEAGDAASTAASPNNNANGAGAAYVFLRSGITWTQQAYLKAANAQGSADPDEPDGDSFGTSVAVFGDTVVVGASREGGDAASTAASPNDNARSAGAAYVFIRSGSTWSQQAYLKAANAERFDEFGNAVAVSGDTIVVGASPKASQAGAAYAFTRSGTTWSQQNLNAANSGDGDFFSWSVAVSGDTVVVGAPYEDGNAASTAGSPNESATDAGAAYVFAAPPSPPTLTSVSPATGSTAGGTTVTLTGTNFTGATGVTFGGTAATAVIVVNATTITCTTPARAAGAASVLVTTPGGTNAANTLFTYVVPPSPPTLTSLTPNSGTTAGGTVVTLTGTNFTGATNVTFGGTAATSLTVNSATSITCTTPAGTAGARSVLVTAPGGTNAPNTLFTYVAPPPPTLTSLTPNSGSTAGGLLVTLTGTNFTGATGVTFGGTAATVVTVVNATTITCTTPAGTAGARSVLVTTPGGTNAANTLFTYVTPPPPGISVIFTDNGTTTTASFSGNLNTSFFPVPDSLAINQFTAYIRPDVGWFGIGGSVTRWASGVVFTRSSGGAGNALGYGSGAGAGGAPITGSGQPFLFIPANGRLELPANYVSGAQISGGSTYPGVTVADLGIVNTEYTLPGNQKIIILNGNPPPPSPPTLTSLSPNSGSTAGGTMVTLTGTNFTGATNVTFGGTAATNRVVVNATTITCTTPAGTAGARSVLVTTPGGTNAANALYTYVAPPTLTSVSPNSGPTAGGTMVTLTGTGFTGATGVAFGGAGPAATNVVVVNATTITCTTPARTAASRSVQVTTPGGFSGTQLFTFVDPASPPTLTSVSPNSGSTAGGTTVTLTGTNFTGATNVTFGGTAATNRTVVNATTITCTTPARAAGTASVLVTTPGGTNAANTLFTYVPQQIVGTLDIYWVGLVGPFAGCGAIETTDGTPADAADGNITMSGVSVSDPCISTATYTFTVSPDGLTLTGADTLNTVPMVLTRTPDQPFFSGLWESGGDRYRAYISAAPFTPSPATLTTAAYTGSNPTLNGGALYGFPIVSDTKSLPATLTVTSTSAGTLLSGNSPVAGNNLNTGFRTNINMTPPAGQFQVIQTISLDLGAFDDGLRLDYNGQTVLDFDFSNYNTNTAVNSMFGGSWTPWTGEGAPIVLELDASGLRLMVTAASNGTGAAAGVLTGQRVNVLNYFTSDTYVPDPADPDFVSGVQIGLYNRNQTGGWAMPNVALTATARVIPRHTAQITRAPGGNPSLLFQGMASQSYLIQRSTNLLNWSTIHTASAAANGTLSYTDTTPPVGRAYYRIALP